MVTEEKTHERRATPADPYPGVEDLSSLDSELRKLPPELGQDALAVLEGRTFFYSDSTGDVPEGSIGGLVHADTRYLNKWVLTVNGHRLLNLRSGISEHYHALFFLTNPDLPGIGSNSFGVRRQRVVGNGLRERVELHNFSPDPQRMEVRLAVGSDFADLFEIKAHVRDRSPEIMHAHASDGSWVSLHYHHNGFDAHTEVEVTPPASRIDGDDLVWDLDLGIDAEWRCDVYVPLPVTDDEIVPPQREFAPVVSLSRDPVADWRDSLATFDSESHLFEETLATTALDLAALRIMMRVGDEDVMLPAAGLPWFLTLFGRDTLITAYQTLCIGPSLARGALAALAAYQAKEHNDFRDEEPGKILHEIRTGELTRLGLRPHNPYYGTADETQLWLILLSEYWRWTADDEYIRSMRENAFAALDWIDLYGDLDDDGYVEYQTRSPQGLGNQCWRDSWDGVIYSDGTIPPLPIGTCELQGYTYDAKMRLAELADGPLDDPALATQLRGEAERLRQRFNNDFWIDERGGYYAVGLDGDKKRIDSMTSNMGHLLWSGIVPEDRAKIVVRQLMSKQMFSGWGVRTLATSDPAYCPIGYHRGTVWPHDNSLIVMGMSRYGYQEEANRLSTAMLEAARFSDHRLPEAFSGYAKDYASFPIPYPTACSPQAWSSCAPLLFGRSMLGLDARDGRIFVDPDIPDEIGHISVTGLKAFGTRWDIEAVGRRGYVRLAR